MQLGEESALEWSAAHAPSMASSRLTDPQKQALVERYSRGEASLALAEAYGVSANTVSRIVKATLPADLYETLKQQRARGGVLSPQAASNPAPEAPIPASAEPAGPESVLGDPTPGASDGSLGDAGEVEISADQTAAHDGRKTATPGASRSRRRSSAGAAEVPSPSALPSAGASEPSIEQQAFDNPQADSAASHSAPTDPATDDRQLEATRPARPVSIRSTAALASRPDPRADSDPGVLAIDDADDFSDDLVDDDFDASDDGVDGMDPFTPIAVSLHAIAGAESVTCRPLTAASFNGGVYMLVDKTVELQPRPLSEFSELGTLPAEEADRQAISLFINPREAKRQCGRSQRVIKMPDPRLLERTAPFLLAQGISRVVMEGALYALPGS